MKAKKILLNLGIFLLSAFIIVYIIVQLITGLTTDVAYQYTGVTSVDDDLKKNGYLVRNETIVYAQNDGVLSYSAKETQKLGVNQLIATIYDSSKGVDVQQQIDRIDQKITILERCAVDTSYLTSDVSKIDNKIFDSLIKARLSVLDNSIDLTAQYKEDLLISFNKRELITTGMENFQDQINALQNEKNQLMQKLENPIESVYCQTPGYFSTLLDGYESIYTPTVVENLTVDYFHDLISKKENETNPLAIGKMISDFHWYTLCEVTNKEAEEFTTGRKYKISYLYSSDKQLHATLEKKVFQTDSDTTVLVFLIEEIPTDFDYTRVQKIRIVKSSVNGVSFPRSALRMVDGEQGVYVISGNAVGFRKVDIIESTDSYYISREPDATEEDRKSYLSRFDRVITEGKGLYVGKILD